MASPYDNRITPAALAMIIAAGIVIGIGLALLTLAALSLLRAVA